METYPPTPLALDQATIASAQWWQDEQAKHWQPADNPSESDDRRSLIARFTGILVALFGEILVALTSQASISHGTLISLNQSHNCFLQWSQGHEITDGLVDDCSERSRGLRTATLQTLTNIYRRLTKGLLPLLVAPPGSVNHLVDIVEEWHSYDLLHDMDSSSGDGLFPFGFGDIEQVAEDLRVDVECHLFELGPMLENPAFDPQPTAETINSTSIWKPHHIFFEMMEVRFPDVDKRLVYWLGEICYERLLRCQTQREAHLDDPDDIDHLESEAETVAGSKYHDSGIGSSVPGMSAYAQTVMSYRNGDRSVSIPPLSADAREGKPFPCVACGKRVVFKLDSAWKRHLFLDLQPYVCLDLECLSRKTPFTDKDSWVSHLAVEHAMEPAWRSIDCPLCGESIKAGKSVIINHLQHHLEELALSALPADLDSDANADSEPPLFQDPTPKTPGKEMEFRHQFLRNGFELKLNAPRIPEEKWEEFREVIIQKFRTTTLQQLMDYMKKEHNFTATKRQYIHRLGHTWGEKKYSRPGAQPGRSRKRSASVFNSQNDSGKA